jgi:transcriptional regulator with XRE-family HTH domain
MGEVGRQIRRLREERGLNQTQLAALIGTGPSAISRIESGRQSPNSETLVKLAGGLGVDVADLFPKAQTPLSFEEPEGEALAERCKRFRDLAAYAEKLQAMFADLYNGWPERPLEEELNRAEVELNKCATAFFGFLDTLNEEGTTSEVIAYLETGDAGEAFIAEVRRLHDGLLGTLKKALPLCTNWLIEQSKHLGETREESDNVVSIRERTDESAKELQLDRLSA